MFFDKLCSITERHFPDIYELLTDAKLFIFPGKAHEIINTDIVKKQVENQDLFRLPFQTVAIEDWGSCVLISDFDENELGINVKRFFLEYIPEYVSADAFDPKIDSYESKEKWENIRSNNKRSANGILSYGVITNINFQNNNSTWDLDGSISGCYFVSKKEKPFDMLEMLKKDNSLKHDFERIKSSFFNNSSVALRELFLFNNPDYFILKEEPTQKKVHKKKKKDMLPRSHERPIYTVLRPTQIREKLGIKQRQTPQQRGSPVPHERRAHLRRLKKESGYKEDRVISVKASWIGESEKTIKNKHYKVLLNK